MTLLVLSLMTFAFITGLLLGGKFHHEALCRPMIRINQERTRRV